MRPATYLGKGKVEELAGLVKTHEAGTRGHGLRALAGATAQPGEGLERQGASTAPA